MKNWVTDTGGIRARWKGVTDIKELYRFMEQWLEDRGLADKKSLEKRYEERMAAGGKNIFITWNGGKKISNYFKYVINIGFTLIGVQDVEVQQENIKRKLSKGDFEVRVYAYVESGTEEWEKLGILQRIYYNFIVAKRLDEYKADLYDKTYKFFNAIKEFLRMRTF